MYDDVTYVYDDVTYVYGDALDFVQALLGKAPTDSRERQGGVSHILGYLHRYTGGISSSWQNNPRTQAPTDSRVQALGGPAPPLALAKGGILGDTMYVCLCVCVCVCVQR